MLLVKAKLKLLVEVCHIVYRYDKFLVVYLIHNTELQFNFDPTKLILLDEIVYNFLFTLVKQVKCSNKINLMIFSFNYVPTVLNLLKNQYSFWC